MQIFLFQRSQKKGFFISWQLCWKKKSNYEYTYKENGKAKKVADIMDYVSNHEENV